MDEVRLADVGISREQPLPHNRPERQPADLGGKLVGQQGDVGDVFRGDVQALGQVAHERRLSLELLLELCGRGALVHLGFDGE